MKEQKIVPFDRDIMPYWKGEWDRITFSLKEGKYMFICGDKTIPIEIPKGYEQVVRLEKVKE